MTGLVGLSSKSGAKRKARHRPRNNLIAKRSLIFGIVAILLTISAASCMQPIVVYASVAGTIKALIMTLCLSMGVGNCNQSTIDALNNSQVLSSSIDDVVNGTISAAQIDSAISGLGVDGQAISAMLENTSSTGAAVTTAANGAVNSLGAASAGTNIVASANAYAQTGEVAAAIGGQALGVFNGLGFLVPIAYQNQVRQENFQKIQQLMNSGLLTNTDTSGNNQLVAGQTMGFIYVGDRVYKCICDYGCIPAMVHSSTYDAGVLAYEVPTHCQRNWNGYERNYTSKQFQAHTSFNTLPAMSGVKYFDSNAEKNAFLNSYEAGDPLFESPDIIGVDGNQKTNYDNTNNIYISPNINPVINYNPTTNQYENNNQYITMVDWDDFEDWADAARQTSNQTNQSELLQEILDTIKNTGTPNPTAAPTQAPINNPIFNPENVVQPTNPEQPPAEIKPILSNEQTQEMLEGMADGSLTSRFPFCIPFDIYALFARINTIEREAPYFDFVLDLGPGGVHHIVVDFSEFDTVAALARALELILFIIGLALGARKIMGE